MRAPVVSRSAKTSLVALILLLACALAQPAVAGEGVPGSLASHAAGLGDSAIAPASTDPGSGDDAPVLAGSLSDGMLRVSADVALVDAAAGGAVEPIVGSFTVDGLTYAIVGEGQVALVAVSSRMLADGLAGGSDGSLDDVPDGGSTGTPSGEGFGSGVPPRSVAEQVPSGAASPSPSPEGASSDGSEDKGSSNPAILEVPESVEYDGAAYSVTSIGPRALAGCDADVVTIPATVESVDDLAFRGSAIKAIEVADGNPIYSSYDGMLFDADLSSLLLIPEGKQGAARIPKTASAITPDAFSHCASVTSVEVEAGSAAYYSENGCLYDAEGLLWLRPERGEGLAISPAPYGAPTLVVNNTSARLTQYSSRTGNTIVYGKTLTSEQLWDFSILDGGAIYFHNGENDDYLWRASIDWNFETLYRESCTGWSLTPNGPPLPDGRLRDTLAGMASPTLYATWHTFSLHIKFAYDRPCPEFPDGAHTHTVSIPFTPGEKLSRTLSDAERTQVIHPGYTFKGLSKHGIEILDEGWATLEPILWGWDEPAEASLVANTYSVVYKDALGERTQGPQAFTYDDSEQELLSAEAASPLARPGYRALGWSKYRGDTSVEYEFGEAAPNVTSVAGASIVLYLVEEPLLYSITYTTTGFDLPPDAPLSYTIDTESFVIPRPEAYGYIFSGWDVAGCEGAGALTTGDGTIILKGTYGDLHITGRMILDYDLMLPIADPKDVTFAVDVQTGEVADDLENGHASTLTSWMPKDVLVESIACEGLDAQGEPAASDEQLMLNSIFGPDASSSVGFSAKLSGLAGDATINVRVGQTERLTGLYIPAAVSPTQCGSLKVAYELEIAEGKKPLSEIRKATPVARMAFAVSLPTAEL